MKKMLFALILALNLLLPALAEDSYPGKIPYEYEGQSYYLTYDGRSFFTLYDAQGHAVKEKLNGWLKYSEATDTYLIHIGEQYGYLDGEGNWLFDLEFDMAYPFWDNGIAAVFKRWLWGYVRTDGSYLMEPQFYYREAYLHEDELRFKDGIVLVRKDDLYGYLREDGSWLVEPQFVYADWPDGDDPALVGIDGKYGYVDKNGAYVIKPVFEDASAFHEGLAAVSPDGKNWGYIDTTGEYVVEPSYFMAYGFVNGLGKVAVRTGSFIDPFGFESDDYVEGLVSRDGSIVLEPVYDSLEIAEDGVITAEKDGEKWIYTFENGMLKETEIVDTTMYLEDYYPFEGKKVVTLDGEADIVWDTDAPYPRLDGATALLPTYAAFAQATYPDDTRYGDANKWIWEDEKDPLFTCTKTNKAYDRLISGDTDIIFCAGPSDAQIADAAAAGVEFELTLMGYESFVFIVNMENPLDNITVQQIKDIYSGKLTQWDELGISDMGEIIAYQRPKNSGSQTALERLMGDTPLMEAPSMWVSDGMEDILETIEYRNYPNAIGYTFRFFCADMVGSKVKLLAIDGVEPNVENINNGTYPIITPLYAVTRKGETNPNVQIFLDWITGEQGQELVEKSGYVGIVERQ